MFVLLVRTPSPISSQLALLDRSSCTRIYISTPIYNITVFVIKTRNRSKPLHFEAVNARWQNHRTKTLHFTHYTIMIVLDFNYMQIKWTNKRTNEKEREKMKWIVNVQLSIKIIFRRNRVNLYTHIIYENELVNLPPFFPGQKLLKMYV